MKALALATRLWLTVALFWLVSIGTISFLLFRLNSAASNYDNVFASEIRQQKQVRLLQVGFKKQVQEWKDILLRGSDPDDLRQFVDQFHQQDLAVQQAAADLRQSVEDPKVRELLDQFVQAHKLLDSNYAAALVVFERGKGKDPFAVDRMVRGQDRPPTDLVDEIATRVSQHTTTKVRALSMAAARTLLALLLVMGVMLLVAVQRMVLSNKALEAGEERYRTLVEASPDAIVATDLAGKITMCNQRAVELYGFSSRAGLVGKDARSLFEEGIEFPINPGNQGRECSLRRQDSTLIPGELTVSPLHDGKVEPIGLMLLIRDLTERKQSEAARVQLETQLVQAQRLESIGRLAGGVAHDFNNLLTVINGYSDLLLRQSTGDAALQRKLTLIRTAGRQAAGLTEQLLAFSRKQVAAPKPISLNAVVSEAEDGIRRQLSEDIEIEVRLDPDSGIVMADPAQMHQVLMNLILNARQSMPSGGKIVIATGCVVLDESSATRHPDAQPGDFAFLLVEDNGVGMSEQMARQIFEPFFTTREFGTGTGLGLAMTYGIARQAGGWIEVRSQPGRGSAFLVHLPRIAGGDYSGTAGPEQVSSSSTGVETVLVVEDQADVRGLTLAVLREEGYSLLEAANGIEALSLCDRHDGQIHLLLTDVVMPGMTGRELADRLQTRYSLLKVLFMSGYTADVIAKQGILDSGVAYLPKPFSPTELIFKVREVLGLPGRPC